MNQMDGVGSVRKAARLAPGEIARLREHAELTGRPVSLAPRASSRIATVVELAPAVAERRPATQPAPRPAPRHPRWRALGTSLAGTVGLAILVGGIFAGQSNPAAHAAKVLGLSHAAARSTPMAVLDTALAEQQELQGLVDNFAAGRSAPFYIYVKDLKTGAAASHDADAAVASASLYKLYVAEQIYSLIDQNILKPAQPTTGLNLNITECLGRMIKVSDNDCGHYLGEMIGWGDQDDLLRDLGYQHTALAQPQQTSVADTGLLLERLYRGQLNSPNSDQAFLALLKAQIYADRLRAGVPAGTVVADKTGNLDGFVHDAGIVYGPRTDYVIAVMTGPWTAPGLAPAQIAKLSGVVWDYLEN
jgi:beta-lactamase class A